MPKCDFFSQEHLWKATSGYHMFIEIVVSVPIPKK